MVKISDFDDSQVVEDRMTALRAKLRRDATSCQQARERWADWRNHVKAHRWLACGIAAAVGYALVPAPRRRGEIASVSLPMTVAPPLPHGQSLLARIGTEIGRRAAQQALAAGTAWALSRLRATQSRGHVPHDLGDGQRTHTPDLEYAP